MSKVSCSLIACGGSIVGASVSFTGNTVIRDRRIASVAALGTLDGTATIDTIVPLALGVHDTILELGRLHVGKPAARASGQ